MRNLFLLTLVLFTTIASADVLGWQPGGKFKANDIITPKINGLDPVFGEDGAPGSMFYSDLGVPTDDTGIDGDIYFDVSGTGDIYHKADGTWGSPIVNITGPAGADGGVSALITTPADNEPIPGTTTVNNSTDVVGVGTNFTDLNVGDELHALDSGDYGTIQSITDDEHLTQSNPYFGDGAENTLAVNRTLFRVDAFAADGDNGSEIHVDHYGNMNFGFGDDGIIISEKWGINTYGVTTTFRGDVKFPLLTANSYLGLDSSYKVVSKTTDPAGMTGSTGTVTTTDGEPTACKTINIGGIGGAFFFTGHAVGTRVGDGGLRGAYERKATVYLAGPGDAQIEGSVGDIHSGTTIDTDNSATGVTFVTDSDNVIFQVTGVGSSQASLVQQDITYEANSPGAYAGAAGNSVSIQYNDGGTAGLETCDFSHPPDLACSIQAGVSTATQVWVAAAVALGSDFTVTITGDGGAAQSDTALTNLSGGADAQSIKWKCGVAYDQVSP